jgi:flagellar biosynthesis anti-sigma factor FlgM
MKINGTDLQSALNVYQSNQAQAKPASADKSGKTEAPTYQQDRLDLSQQGRLLADAQKAIGSVPDVRESLVTEIRNDIENGSYVVDHQKAAEGILKEALVNQAAML